MLLRLASESGLGDLDHVDHRVRRAQHGSSRWLAPGRSSDRSEVVTT